MAQPMLALLNQPPGFFDLTFPKTPDVWLILSLSCCAMGTLMLVFMRRLIQVLRLLPSGRQQRRWFWLGSLGLLLGIGGFWVCLTLEILWGFTLWWLWLLGAVFQALGGTLYNKAKEHTIELAQRLEEQERENRSGYGTQ